MSARAAAVMKGNRKRGRVARGAAGNSPASLQKNCPHVKEQPRRSLWRRARRAGRMWVRLFSGVALRPPRSSTVSGADFPALFPVFAFVGYRDTRAFICALTLWYRRKRLFAASLSCNRICSEDRAIVCKTLILLTWTVLYLLHMTGYVTGCFFVVTTSRTLRMASDAVSSPIVAKTSRCDARMRRTAHERHAPSGCNCETSAESQPNRRQANPNGEVI